MLFRDKIVIEVKSGDGGNGACSFRKEKYIPLGGPDGGDGGCGGSVYIMASASQSHLGHINRMHYRATKGKNGEGANRTGASGEDIELYVPVGTQIWERIDGQSLEPDAGSTIHDSISDKYCDDESRWKEECDDESGFLTDLEVFAPTIEKIENGKRYRLVHDLLAEERYCVVAGGLGGAGNARFATSTNRAPRKCNPGKKGQTMTIQLRLRLAAQFGLFGERECRQIIHTCSDHQRYTNCCIVRIYHDQPTNWNHKNQVVRD